MDRTLLQVFTWNTSICVLDSPYGRENLCIAQFLHSMQWRVWKLLKQRPLRAFLARHPDALRSPGFKLYFSGPWAYLSGVVSSCQGCGGSVCHDTPQRPRSSNSARSPVLTAKNPKPEVVAATCDDRKQLQSFQWPGDKSLSVRILYVHVFVCVCVCACVHTNLFNARFETSRSPVEGAEHTNPYFEKTRVPMLSFVQNRMLDDGTC